MRVIRVGVAGLGLVGSSAARLLGAARDAFRRRLGAKVIVAAVCDRRVAAAARGLGLPRGARRLRDWRGLARDPSLDVVVETMGGLADARSFVLEALAAGKEVVTANKRLLAHHWDELFRAARAAGRGVRFEASVAGGVPVLHALDRSLAADRVERVLGILNGTTNFILTRMTRDGAELGPALQEAQRLGLAERDPRLDLDGTDAANKVAVLAALLTGRGLVPKTIARTGILGLRAEDLRFAIDELGRAARLLGTVAVDWDAEPARLTAYVAPTLVPLDHPLAGVHDEYNAVLIQARAAGDLLFYGKGAGADPAGSAVAGDVFLAAEALLAGAPAVRRLPGPPVAAVPVLETVAPFYLRLRVADRPGVLARVTSRLARGGISIAQMRQGKPSGHDPVTLHLTTHPARHGVMARAVRAILSLPFVSRDHAWLRML